MVRAQQHTHERAMKDQAEDMQDAHQETALNLVVLDLVLAQLEGIAEIQECEAQQRDQKDH
jgi:DNA-binding response OmpR family regulator